MGRIQRNLLLAYLIFHFGLSLSEALNQAQAGNLAFPAKTRWAAPSPNVQPIWYWKMIRITDNISPLLFILVPVQAG